MPMIDVYAKEGTFADKHALAQNPTAAVKRWERVPDPHGFLIYFRNDVHPVMELAGDRADCVAYPMGNHVIAEQFASFDISEIAEVGIELDRKLAALLDALEVRFPASSSSDD
jgi:hypothetical protein